MKLLKAICSISGFMFFLCLVAVPFMFEAGTIKEWRICAVLIILYALLIAACMLGYRIIEDHESNTDLSIKKAPKDGRPIRGTCK
jgi:hypothetical protein